MVESFSIAVMAHHTRRDRAAALQAKLSGRGASVGLVIDEVSAGCWACSKRAWELAPESGHHMVVADDAIPCVDFVEAASELRLLWPDRPMSFFIMRKGTKDIAEKAGSRWVVLADFICPVAISIPVGMVRDMLTWVGEREGPEFEKRRKRPWFKNDDYRMGDYFAAKAIPVMLTMPNLVDHDLSVRSVMGHAATLFGNPRCSPLFVGADKRALDLDWSLGLNDPARG